MSHKLNLWVLNVSNVQWGCPLRSKGVCVKVQLGDTVRKTRRLKGEPYNWHEILTFQHTEFTDLTITVIHESKLKCLDVVLGSSIIGLDELSSRCKKGPISLLLKSQRLNNQKTPYLTIRLLPDQITPLHIQDSFNNPTQSAYQVENEGLDMAKDIVPLLNGESDLFKSIAALFLKVDVVVKIVDELSKVHPFLNVAWQITSSLYKIVAHQLETDRLFVNLVRVMEGAYDFVTDAEKLSDKAENFKSTINELLQQTIECCYFIQHYANRNFPERIFHMSRDKVDEFTKCFVELKKNLDSDTVLHTAFVSARILEKVNEMYLRDKLMPSSMNSSDHQICFEDTRFELLNHITDWLLSDTTQNILWLHGGAGSGKSTIATTIAESCGNISRLGASLFFSRVNSAKDQLKPIFPTIAFKLACFDSSIAQHIEGAVRRSEYAISASPKCQFKELLKIPLTDASNEVHSPIVIILDALDECGTPSARRSLMELLKGEFGELPPNFRFLITSRPEDDIVAALSNRPNSVHEIRLDSGSADSRRDVLRYIDYEMSRIVNATRIIIPDDWLWSKQMEKLADASEGLFIWASTAINLVAESSSKFRKLNELVNASNRLKGIDQLYEEVLRNSRVIAMDDPSSILRFQRVLGLVLLSRIPLSDITIDAILGLPRAEPSHEILSKLGSVLSFRQGEPIRVLHTSFSDYLLSTRCSQPCNKHTNPSECPSDLWSIDEASQQSAIAMQCFIVMKDMLHFNMCGLESSFVCNKNVTGIEDRIDKKLPSHLQYACVYWAQHLIDAPYSPELIDELTSFARRQLLYWFEVISLKGLVHSVASRALMDAAAWSGEHDSDISSFLKDASKLASEFAIPMTESTPHIYVSMLPLMKGESEVAAHYSKQTSRVVVVDRIGTKRPPLWLKVLEGHSDIVQSVAFSSDGKYVASGSDDGTTKVWDVESGEVLCEFFEENKPDVNSVTFSPDGRRVASGSWDGTVTIWDIESRESVSGPFEGHTEGVWAVAFAPDGTHIASASEDTTIRVWDVKSGSTVHVLEGHTAAVCSVAFSSDGKRIVSGSEDKTIRVWDATTGQTIGEPFVGHTREVRSVAISPDGRRIVSGSGDFTVRVWDVESGKVVAGPFRHSNIVNSVAFSSDGKRVVSGSSDDTIVVWDVESGDIVSGPFTGHADSVVSVAFSPDGSRIVSGSRDKTVKLWDASIGKVVSDSSTRHTDAVMSVAFSPDGSRIASASRDKTVRIWDALTGEAASAPFEGHENYVYSVAFSPDDKRIVSGSKDESVIVWDVNSGKMAFEPLKEHSDAVMSAAFSPNGTQIVSGSGDRAIIIWNAENGDMIARSEQVHSTWIDIVAFSPDGTLVASASVDNDVVVWSAENGRCVSGPFKAPKDSTQHDDAPLAFSPDGRCIASRSSNNDIIIRDVQSGRIVSVPLKGHSDTVTSVAFSHEGAHIVSGSYDRTIIVWDASNGNIVSEPYSGHASPVTCVAFSPDSSRIVSCSYDATIRIWTVPGKQDDSLTNRNLQGNVVASCSNVQDVADGLVSWTLADSGWVLGPQGELLLWLPPDIRPTLWRPQNTAVFNCEFSTKLNFEDVAHGLHWQECFNSDV